MRESYIERAVNQVAKQNGWLSYKLSGTGNRGKPDRVYLKDGRAVFVEYKADRNGRITALQRKQHSKLQEQGFEVLIINDWNKGKQLAAHDFRE